MARLCRPLPLLILLVLLGGVINFFSLHFVTKSFPVLNGSPPGIVVVIQPSVVNPSLRVERLAAISKTWGRHFDEVVVVTSSPSELASFGNLGPGSRIRPLFLEDLVGIEGAKPLDVFKSFFKAIAETYAGENPPYIYLCNDHTFVIPSNLKRIISNSAGILPPPSSSSVYHGNLMREGGRNILFASGASGLITSPSTMRRFNEGIDDLKPSSFEQGNPGLLFAKILQNDIDVPPEFGEKGGDRFHVYPPGRIANGDFDQWYVMKKTSVNGNVVVGAPYTDTSSPNVVSFHYVSSLETLALYSLLINPRSIDVMTAEKVIRNYPKKGNGEANGLSGYSANIDEMTVEYLRDYVRVAL